MINPLRVYRKFFKNAAQVERIHRSVKFISLLNGYWRYVFVFIICDLVIILLSLLPPILTKILIDNVIIKHEIEKLAKVVWATFFISIILASLRFLRNYYISYVQHALAYEIKFEFCKRMQRLSFSFWDKNEVAEVLSRLTDGSTSRRLLLSIVSKIINNSLYLTVVPIALFIMNWKLALTATILLPLMAYSFVTFSKKVHNFAQLAAKERGELAAKNHEFFAGMREIQALSIEDRVLRRLKRFHLKYRKHDMLMRIFGSAKNLCDSLVRAAAILLYTWYGSTLVLKGQMSLGELMAFTALVAYLFNPIAGIAELMTPIQEVLVNSNRFYEVFAQEPSLMNPLKPIKIKKVIGAVRFSTVSFKYDDDNYALKDVSFDIPAGTKVAIVGKTGSGKSTFLTLIPRFYHIQKGKITIDGININEIRLKDLRNNIAIVMQSPFIFFGSILENVAGLRAGYSRDQIIDACCKVNAHDFISELPNGYETIIGENGVNLSGGEKQRLALARAILLKKPIILLDEVTANIDRQTEANIIKKLMNFEKDKTILMVTHRLETACMADVILVMDKGQIIEHGKYTDLISVGGHFHQLATSSLFN